MAEEKPKGASGWAFDRILTPVITATLGILIGSWWNTSAPYLRVSPGEIITFSGEKEEFGLFVTSVTNDGNKMAENGRCDIALSDCTIQDLKVGPENLKTTLSWGEGNDRSKVTIFFESLNPTENLQIAVKASEPTKLRTSRRIAVRANGVVGSVGQRPQYAVMQGALGTAIALGVGVALVPIMLYTFNLFSRVAERFTRFRDSRRKKKRLVFKSGPARGKSVEGDEASELFDRMTMHGKRMTFENVHYKAWDRKVDDDGTLELIMLEE
jgi:hypothetical protein